MRTIDNEPVFNPNSVTDWCNWLEENGVTENAIWLVIRHKSAKEKGVFMAEAMANAFALGG